MKLLGIIVLSFFCLISSQCSTVNKAQETTPTMLDSQSDITVGQVYFQKWIAGLEEGGSGINIYFPDLLNKNNYIIDSVYFREMTGKMQSGKTAYFAKLSSKNRDVMMTNEPNGEFGNTIPNNSEIFPFKLKDNECVIRFIDSGKTKYIQINDIVEKEAQYYPSAPPKQDKE